MKKLFWILLMLSAVFIRLWISNCFGDETVSTFQVHYTQCAICQMVTQTPHRVGNTYYCEECYQIAKKQAIDFIVNDYINKEVDNAR